MSTVLLRIDLIDADPAVWREVRVPADVGLVDLHHVVQVAMGWEDTHPHGFARGEGYWATRTRWSIDPEFEEAEERGADLQEALGDQSVLTYMYDPGDDWEHRLTVLETSPGTSEHAELVGGEGACPPEDSGGVFAFAELVSMLRRLQSGEDLDGWDGDRLHHLVGDGDPEELAHKLLVFDDVLIRAQLEGTPVSGLADLPHDGV